MIDARAAYFLAGGIMPYGSNSCSRSSSTLRKRIEERRDDG
jgi:hypothetical protein